MAEMLCNLCAEQWTDNNANVKIFVGERIHWAQQMAE